MRKIGTKIRLYFRNKRFHNFMYSSEVFDNSNESLLIFDQTQIDDESTHKVKFKECHSIDDVLNNADIFTICTDDSFTRSELMMIQDVIYASGRKVYDDEKVLSVVRKIESMLINGTYLPEDKNDIIKNKRR